MTTTKVEGTRKRRVVAAGKIAGKPSRKIAKEIGVTPNQVARIARQPATRLLIEELLEPEYERIRELAHKAVSAVDRALEAKNSRGRHLYEIQLRGVGRFATLAHLAAGDRPPEAQIPGAMTWQQFLIFCQQLPAVTHADSVAD